MKQSIKTVLKYILNKLRDKVFIISVVIATLLLLIAKLSKSYNYTITLPIVITGAISDYDKDVIANDDKVYFVNAKFEGKGFDLIDVMMRKRIVVSPEDIIIEKSSSSGLFSINVESLRRALSSQFPDVNLNAILNNSIILQTTSFAQKRVPLVSKVNINTKGEYMQVGKTLFTPDSVTVYGTRSVIDTIKQVATEYLYIRRPKSIINGDIKIQRNNSYEITPREATFVINMSRYTEIIKKVKVSIDNFDDSFKYTIFPNEVTVSFNISQNIFSVFEPDSVRFFIERRNKNDKSSNASFIGDDRYIIKHSSIPVGVEIRSINPPAVSVYEIISK